MSSKKMIVFFICICMIIPALSIANLNQETHVSFKRCMNIGNALDAPKDIPWDVEMKTEYFDRIKEAGFDCVRLPVRFSDYAKDQPHFLLQETLMKKIDTYLHYALDRGLVVILDFHHFIEIMEQPERYKDCYLSIWRQLAERYKSYPNQLVFELLNEPTGQLKGDLWNQYLAEAVSTVRKTNKERLLIVGPDQYNSIDSLEYLALPEDKHLMVTFHFYEPNTFTFQGNAYLKGFEDLRNIPWDGTVEEIQQVRDRMAIVKEWAAAHQVPVFMGEFGAMQNAPASSRLLWTSTVRSIAEEMGFSWGYWELCSVFGIYNAQTSKWDNEMLRALMKEK